VTLRSMTGFGRARRPLGPGWLADLSARAVNHRFLDLSVRLREAEGALEAPIRQVFVRRLARGKVELTLRLTRTGRAGPAVAVDEPLLEALLERFGELSRKYPIKGTLEARDLAAFPQLLSIDASPNGFSPEELAEAERLAEEVAAGVISMREEEGARIAADLLERIASLQRKLEPLASRRDEIVRTTAAALRERMRTLFSDLPLDSGRLEQEAALAAERSDVAEELQRLAGHLSQFRGLVEHPPGPVGKKLDFLSQEILREINTLGSKAKDLALLRDVLDMKAETEKIREQVQNVE
jgi:uncharacterized protein (TIGR00255 family)